MDPILPPINPELDLTVEMIRPYLTDIGQYEVRHAIDKMRIDALLRTVSGLEEEETHG